MGDLPEQADEVIEPYVDVAETHSGAVLFVGDRAYKLKKPLDLGFVDYRSVEARRAACEEEVRLNRRLVPDVYLGVGSLAGDGTDEPVVVMRRLPPQRRLSKLVGSGTVEGCIRRVAHLMAGFHAGAERTAIAERAASGPATLARWQANADAMAAFEGQHLPEGSSASVLDEARRYVGARGRLFDHRIAAGRARDGHGDLLAQDIFCLDSGPVVLDCLEFDETLRSGDVLADIAFLAMDLERLGHPRESWDLLRLHRELLGDDWPESLAHHHIAYRAQVRAKVACIRIAQGGSSDEDPGELLAIARRHLRRGQVNVAMVGGLPGSGKSTVAEALAARTGAVVIASDEVRKELAGIAPLESAAAPPGEGIYDPDHTARTYDEIIHRSRRLLEMGESVVVDASFTEAGLRASVRTLAAEVAAQLVELRCTAPESVLADRVVQRAAAGPSTSDADPLVVRAMAERFAPWPEATDLDTTQPLEGSVERAAGLVEGPG